MKLSKRGEYALRALIDLGVAQELGRPLLSISELSAKEKIPVAFLEQIFFQLRSAGIVGSARGKRGGYTLARPAEEIRFGEIVRLIDGPLAPIRCVSQMAYAPCTCPDEMHCGLRLLMLDVRNAIARILDKYTLADVVSVTLRRLRRDKLASPFLPPAELSVLFSEAAPAMRRQANRQSTSSKITRNRPSLRTGSSSGSSVASHLARKPTHLGQTQVVHDYLCSAP